MGKTGPINVTPKISTDTAGASHGRLTAAFFITAHRPVPMANRGANEKNSCGGMNRPENGRANDVPDFVATKPPDYQPPEGAEGDDALAGDKPFILHADGLGWIWVPAGLKDGPLPAHYEPLESPVRNPMYPKRQSNPVADTRTRVAETNMPLLPTMRFPFVLTTYRLTEHHTAGGMSRTLSHLAELQPEIVLRDFAPNWRSNFRLSRANG